MFVFFLFTIVLYVLLRLMVSDYSCIIFKLFHCAVSVGIGNILIDLYTGFI
jgi:hypothetical protein